MFIKTNKKLLLPKKNPLPYVKTTLSYLENFMFFFFFNSKHSKIFTIQILYTYLKSPSNRTNVYHISFVQILNFVTYNNSYPNQ